KLLAGETGSREALVASARELLHQAERPMESVAWSFWAQPARTAATRIAVDLKIFETAIAEDGRPKTAEELAAPTGASPGLVDRIARMCVSMRMIDGKGSGLYAPNPLTHTLVLPECAGGIVFHYDCTVLTWAKLPEYLRRTNFQNPEDTRKGPWPYANGVDYPFTEQNPKDNPVAFHAFHNYIQYHRPLWTDMYLCKEYLVDGLKSEGDSSAFIDLGGKLRRDIPSYTGRLILQERPHIIALAKSKGIDADGRIEAQAHDFFTPQPIKGARAYYMRSVLHDWPDEKCREILAQLKAVMEPGYSKILLNEYMLDNDRPDWRPLSLDLLMMVVNAASERSERQWRDLITSAGLKSTGIFSNGDEGTESVIEVML
ncbi:S-adenosyl-L-methionine-dependent methyltransferase, partial [Cryphonectria parasitica EP155]